MSKMAKIVGASALGLSIAVSVPVLGAAMHGHDHDAAGPGHEMHSGNINPGKMHMGMIHSEANHAQNMEQHLGSLKASLQLTAEQQPAWDQFERAVKTMATNHPAGHAHGDHAPGNQGGGADAHFAQMEQHLALMKTVVEARKALYQTLSDEQKDAMKNFAPGSFGRNG